MCTDIVHSGWSSCPTVYAQVQIAGNLDVFYSPITPQTQWTCLKLVSLGQVGQRQAPRSAARGATVVHVGFEVWVLPAEFAVTPVRPSAHDSNTVQHNIYVVVRHRDSVTLAHW